MYVGSRCAGDSCKCLDSHWSCSWAEDWGSTHSNELWYAFWRDGKHFSSSELVGEFFFLFFIFVYACACVRLRARLCVRVGLAIALYTFFSLLIWNCGSQRMISMSDIIRFKFWLPFLAIHQIGIIFNCFNVHICTLFFFFRFFHCTAIFRFLGLNLLTLFSDYKKQFLPLLKE